MNQRRLALILVLSNAVWCGNAVAYDSSDDSVVTKERQLEQYTPKGIRLGSFNILPKMDLNNEYNTNIFYRDSKTNQVNDSYIAHWMPGVAARSDWNRHALNLTFNSDITQYSTLPSQAEYNDLFTTLDGKLDLTRDSYFNGIFSYNSIHENRGSPDQINGLGPTFYDTKIIDGYYNQRFNRISVKTGIDTIRYDYQNVQSSNGTTLLMSSRDHWEYMPSMRIGYFIQPEYEAFVKFLYKNASYDTLTLANGVNDPVNRNSTGYNVTGGMAFDLTGLITGDMSIGYLERTYESPRLNKISGINGFLNLKWRPTELTSVNAKFSRDIMETTQPGVAGVLASAVALNVNHELLRNVILSAGGMYGYNQYEGFQFSPTPNASNFNRIDSIYGGRGGVTYLLNRNFSTELSYTYQSRDSNYQLSGYNVNQVMLNLKGHF